MDRRAGLGAELGRTPLTTTWTEADTGTKVISTWCGGRNYFRRGVCCRREAGREVFGAADMGRIGQMAQSREQVAFLGIGAMGHGMAMSSLRSGIPTVVWN